MSVPSNTVYKYSIGGYGIKVLDSPRLHRQRKGRRRPVTVFDHQELADHFGVEPDQVKAAPRRGRMAVSRRTQRVNCGPHPRESNHEITRLENCSGSPSAHWRCRVLQPSRSRNRSLSGATACGWPAISGSRTACSRRKTPRAAHGARLGRHEVPPQSGLRAAVSPRWATWC